MMLPATNFQLTYWNPGATMPLIIPLQAECNTPDDALTANIYANSRATDKWVDMVEPHGMRAVICGSGPSLADTLAEIRAAVTQGAKVFALNGAARFLEDNGIMPDYQVILDARQETAQLAGPAREHLLASQVHPDTLKKAPDAWLFHSEMGETEKHLPRNEGYVLLSGFASAGNTALVLAYAMGYRTIALHGYDSSHKGAASHPFAQPMNHGEPCVWTTFNGKEYLASIVMKMQAERFQIIARQLQEMGCSIEVYGYGLLPDMWKAPVSELTEEEKYERMWGFPQYRRYASGEEAAADFLTLCQFSEGEAVIDFGCGTGRGALKLKEAGLAPLLVDFAVNCRDPEAYRLPFLKLDLTARLPLSAPYGFCTDVMEHIPPANVETVIGNIMAAAPKVFFQISTIPDSSGALIGQPLHLTVEPHGWWLALFEKSYRVEFDREGDIASQFVITRKD